MAKAPYRSYYKNIMNLIRGFELVNQKFPLQDISATNWRTIIGVVPQQIHIFNASVLENIAFDDAANHQQKVIYFYMNLDFQILLINCHNLLQH